MLPQNMYNQFVQSNDESSKGGSDGLTFLPILSLANKKQTDMT
jgi:hypothetical protein